MTDVRRLLEAERELEREFVASDRADPKGWSVALTMFHFLSWRELLHDVLAAVREGRRHSPPPRNIDEFNDRELAGASRVSLAESARSTDSLLVSLIDLYESLGDRPFTWYRWSTTSEAILGSACIHPRTHIVQYLKENDDLAGAVRVLERTVPELRGASAPPFILGVEIYNLACLRVAEERHDDAMKLIEESVAMRPSLKVFAVDDPDLAPLRNLERFRAITQSER